MNKTQIQTPEQYTPCGLYTGQFSNGMDYLAPCDRGFYKAKEEYCQGFTERDQLLDAAINRGYDLHLGGNLWHVYDDAVNNYSLTPIDPYEWLFKHATLTNKSVIVSKVRDRILLLYGASHISYYDFIHGLGSYFDRYARPVY